MNLVVEKETGNFGLKDAASDLTTMNYIVAENEIQNNTDVIKVNGTKFNISGADIDLNGNKGIEIQDNNKLTEINTSIINSSGTTITDLGEIVKLNAENKDITVSSLDTDNVIDLKGEASNLILSSATNKINGEGTITGVDKNAVTTEGKAVNLGGLNNIDISQEADVLFFNGNVVNSELNLKNGFTQFSKDSYLSNSDNSLILSGGDLSVLNNQTSDIKLGSLELNSNSNLYLDVDLGKLTSDKFAFANSNDVNTNGYTLNIKDVNLVNPQAGLTKASYAIPFISSEYNNTNLAEIVKTDNVFDKNILTPIYKYSMGFVSEADRAYFSLNRVGNPSDWRSLNPSILVSPVATQVGGYLTQLNNYEQAFNNMDMLMIMPKSQRDAMKYGNKYAYSEATGQSGTFTFSPNQIPEKDRGLWFKPYATFEKVGLKNGPNVENVAYGSLFGGDSDIIELKKGWDMVYSAYAGYTGSHQNYYGNSIYQNGGLIGASSIFYRGNFFTGLTANVGASAGEASTMYGNDNFSMLSTGIASKTGYNFEFADSKFIIQPSWLMSYSFINTFDYRTAAGVKINSDPLNAIQLSPQLKFIGNLKNNWQPYVTVAMVWNILDETKFRANNVMLPEMSIKPYVQYGVGIQKRWSDAITAFGQAMIRNGGRNGIAFQFGFRWALGKK